MRRFTSEEFWGEGFPTKEWSVENWSRRLPGQIGHGVGKKQSGGYDARLHLCMRAKLFGFY